MDNQTSDKKVSVYHTLTYTNPNSPMNLEEDLSQNFANSSPCSSTLDNSNVAATSLSIYPQFQIPRNTQFNYGLNYPGEGFPSASSPFMPGNSFFDWFLNGGLLGANSGKTIQELEYPETIQDSFIKKALNDTGSRELQEIIKMRKAQFTEPILEKLMEKSQAGVPYILYLMVNQYGCHVFSKLIEACNFQQLITVITQITSDRVLFVDVCSTKFGSCSVLRLIRVLQKSPLVFSVVSTLAVQFNRLMTEKFGLYVLSECLDRLDETQNELLYKASVMYCLRVATNKQGCIALNAVIEKIRGPHREILIRKVCEFAVSLAFDPSGNYVVQRVLALENPEFTHIIVMKLRGRYASLSRLKGGSHLVERCLLSTGMITVVEDLIRSNQVVSLAEDRFGNYVIQTAYKATKAIASTSKLHYDLVGCLYPFLPKLQIGIGRNVYNLIAGDILQSEPVQPSLSMPAC